MNFFELDISYFRSNENLFVGLFHGILLSLPFSVPFFLCLRYFLFDGIHIGMSAFLGILFGQISFLSLMSLGYRPLIQFWYTSEPFLSFLGMSLLLKLATDFYHQKVSLLSGGAADFVIRRGDALLNIDTAEPSLGGAFARSARSNSIRAIQSLWPAVSRISNITAPKQIFLLNFCLMFLNPIFPATASRLLLSQDIVSHFGFMYILGFIAGSFGILLSFIFLLKGAASIWRVTGAVGHSLYGKAHRGTESQSSGRSPSFFLNKLLSFCIIGTLLLGSIQYTWRLVTQYPMEFLPSMTAVSSLTNVKTEYNNSPAVDEAGQLRPGEGKITKIFQREFPSFDSNIRHREKNLPVDRHLPIERINARRTLSGRPPLNEEQKSDAYLKYNSFFLNKIEEILDDAKIKYRTTVRHESSLKQQSSLTEGQYRNSRSTDSSIRVSNQPSVKLNIDSSMSYETIRQLQKIKERYSLQQNRGSAVSRSEYATSTQHGRSTTQSTAPPESKKLQNNTKGKPKFSYIRELFENTQKSPYLHDDLHVYQAIFRQIVPSL